MSFRCGACGKKVEHGVESTVVPMLFRGVAYGPRSEANRDGSDDPGGRGVEIVQERRVGPCCAEV